MKRRAIVMRCHVAVALAAGLLSVGCQDDKSSASSAAKDEHALTDYEKSRDFDAGLVTAVRDAAVKNGIISQHTLFPYHFVPDSAALNELGQRDVAVLAEHFREAGSGGSKATPSGVNVRRGGTPDALYNARVHAVTEELAHAGIPADRIQIADGVPGGDGMPSDRVALVLTRDRNTKLYYKVVETTGSVEVTENRTVNNNSGDSGSK